MHELTLLDRWLMFGAVALMVSALALYIAARTESCWRPVVRWFRSRSLFGRVLILLSLFAVSVYGGSKGGADTNAPSGPVGAPRTRSPAQPSLPAWYLAAGYPALDTDGDGIPDAWEKWTHTNPFHADSGSDPDADGLTNLEEFEAQTDPLCGDTDGDGLGDADEIAGLSAQTPDLDPLRPASFAVEEPDADADGIPDVWEGAPISPLSGLDPTGFPLDVFPPPLSGSNYDVVASVTSSRACALVWGDDSDESVLLPPCTNLAVRIRLSSDAVRTVRLLPAPNAGSSPGGLWKARLSASWDDRRALETEGNRLMTGDGTAIDRSREMSAFVGLLPRPPPTGGGPLRTPMAWDGRFPFMEFVPRTLRIHATPFCSKHGPIPEFSVLDENADPPYIWVVNGSPFETDSRTLVLSNPIFADDSYHVICTWKDAHTSLLVRDTAHFTAFTCDEGTTNIVGAAWSSSHDPMDASDHCPTVTIDSIVYSGPNCPYATNVTIAAGYSHSESLLLTRNLPLDLTGDPKDDETDHCLGVIWRKGESINLESFFSWETKLVKERLGFQITRYGPENDASYYTRNTVLSFGACPDNLKPVVYHVALILFPEGTVLDRMWIVVSSPDSLALFDSWSIDNADISWTAVLPQAFQSIVLINGEIDATVSYPGWQKPFRSQSFLHHNAVFEMRSDPVGEYGNQATYDSSGILIQSTMSAGTADKSHPLNFVLSMTSVIGELHYRSDVVPFLRAVNLDGNPGTYSSRLIPTTLTRPCLYQGSHVETYMSLRPISPTGTQTLP